MVTKQICFDRSVGLEVPGSHLVFRRLFPTMKLDKDLKMRIIAVSEKSKGMMFRLEPLSLKW